MDKRKRTTDQTMIYKTLHRTLKMEQHYILGMNLGAPEDRATLYTGDELGFSGRSSNTIYWG
jgi:hypothetical protein